MYQLLKTDLLRPMISVGLLLTAVCVVYGMHEVTPPGAATKIVASNETEARQQAQLLHETFHATLHFVHEEYYRPNERLTLPSATLERVFQELAVRRHVKLHWLAVNAKAMNVDHEPQDDFERDAVQALGAGKEEFERVDDDVFRHAGVITLTSDCLKCHLPGRTSNKERAAALVISIPLRKPSDKSQ